MTTTASVKTDGTTTAAGIHPAPPATPARDPRPDDPAGPVLIHLEPDGQRCRPGELCV